MHPSPAELDHMVQVEQAPRPYTSSKPEQNKISGPPKK